MDLKKRECEMDQRRKKWNRLEEVTVQNGPVMKKKQCKMDGNKRMDLKKKNRGIDRKRNSVGNISQTIRSLKESKEECLWNGLEIDIVQNGSDGETAWNVSEESALYGLEEEIVGNAWEMKERSNRPEVEGGSNG